MFINKNIKGSTIFSLEIYIQTTFAKYFQDHFNTQTCHFANIQYFHYFAIAGAWVKKIESSKKFSVKSYIRTTFAKYFTWCDTSGMLFIIPKVYGHVLKKDWLAKVYYKNSHYRTKFGNFVYLVKDCPIRKNWWCSKGNKILKKGCKHYNDLHWKLLTNTFFKTMEYFWRQSLNK